jgi:hypothetical protein
VFSTARQPARYAAYRPSERRGAEIPCSSGNLLPDIVKISTDKWLYDESFTPCLNPSASTGRGGTVVSATIVHFAQDVDCLDTGQNGKICDAVCRAESPHGAKPSQMRGKTGLDPFADVQTECQDFISIELDCSTARATKHLTVKLAPCAIEKGSMNAAGFITCDVAKQAEQSPDSAIIQFQLGVKPNDSARMLVEES